MQRHHAGLRRDRRGVGGGDDREIDVARPDQLQDLRLLPELRARILVDQHRALAQFLELGREYVVGDAVSGIELLVVREAIVLYLLRACASGEHQRQRCNDQTYRSLQTFHRATSPCFGFWQFSHHGPAIVN